MKIKAINFCLILIIIYPYSATAQINITVPNDVKNNRFYEDIFNVQRPALSLVGFDNEGDNSRGYGLKQVLEKLYNGSAGQLMVNTYNKILEISSQPLRNPFNVSGQTPLQVVNNNSNKLQSKAFIALARYILFKNGIINNIPDSTQAAPPY